MNNTTRSPIKPTLPAFCLETGLRNHAGIGRVKQAGQSLVEFVLIMPILVLAAVAAGTMTVGAHQSHATALAMSQITMYKLDYAKSDGAISSGKLGGDISGGGFIGPFKNIPAVDSVKIVSIDPYTDLAVGQKNYSPGLTTMVPGFSITSGQVINHNLLQAMSAGTAVVHPATPWVPGGTPLPPPWP